MTRDELDRILSGIGKTTIAVIGDFCLDRYFHIDPAIRDVSVETGLPIHQVVSVRSSGGGGGNVLANLAALEPARVLPVGFIGVDGEGFELKLSLAGTAVSFEFVEEVEDRPTPAYIKPMVFENGAWKETSRFDIFPREPLSEERANLLLANLEKALEDSDALIVSDYWETGKEGVVTPRIRERLVEMAEQRASLPVFVDSRMFVDEFRNAYIKPNEKEAACFLGLDSTDELSIDQLMDAGCRIAGRNGRTVFMTIGERGMLVCRDDGATHLPAYTVDGEIDIVGAGDTVVAAVTCALAAGACHEDAGLIGVLAASVTVQQTGTTGVAAPPQILGRFDEYAQRFPDVVRS